MNKKDAKKWIITYAAIAVLLISIYYLLDLKIFGHWQEYIPVIKKLIISLFLIALIFLTSRIINKIIKTQTHMEGDRYNLLRVNRFLTIIFSFIVATSFLFQNLYAAVVSFGLISLILGFALQAPMASFIAWVYLVFRRTYLVGDRIQIKEFRGDVIEINYLDTSILECRGDYLGNDRRSGRIIRFPNSLILKEEVINYSGPEAPFIWDETAIQVAYTSDIHFVEECLVNAAESDFKIRFPKIEIIKNNQWKPTVYFRINTFAWLEAVLSYPVEPEDTTGKRNRILRLALPMLNSAPDKVKFPEGTMR